MDLMFTGDPICPACGGRRGFVLTINGTFTLDTASMPVHTLESRADDIVTTERHYRDGAVEITKVRHTLVSHERRETPSVRLSFAPHDGTTVWTKDVPVVDDRLDPVGAAAAATNDRDLALQDEQAGLGDDGAVDEGAVAPAPPVEVDGPAGDRAVSDED